MIPDLTKTVVVLGGCTSSAASSPEVTTHHDVTYDRVCDTQMKDVMSRWLPSNGDVSTVVWTKLGQSGASLSLPDLGEYLLLVTTETSFFS